MIVAQGHELTMRQKFHASVNQSARIQQKLFFLPLPSKPKDGSSHLNPFLLHIIKRCAKSCRIVFCKNDHIQSERLPTEAAQYGLISAEIDAVKKDEYVQLRTRGFKGGSNPAEADESWRNMLAAGPWCAFGIQIRDGNNVSSAKVFTESMTALMDHVYMHGEEWEEDPVNQSRGPYGGAVIYLT